MFAGSCLLALAWCCVEPPSSGQGSSGRRDAEAKAAFAALVEQAHDPKPDKRRSAVKALAQFGTEPAWRVVVEALADEESAVGDAAQLVVARIADPKIALLLLDDLGLEHREPRVAERAAEALGRLVAPVDGEKLARALSTRHAERTRLLLWSIERLAQKKKLVGREDRIADAIERVESSRSEVELSCGALMALAQVAPDRARARAIQALRDREPERRCAAALVLGAARAPEAFAAGLALAADRDVRVRMRGVECLDAVGTKAAMVALIGRLAEEQRLRIRWRIVELLQSSSGLKHRFDARPWKLWAEELPEGGVIRRGPPPKDQGSDGGQATRSSGLAGLSVISDRVTFLFDFSGSMWTSIPDGRLPKDIVADKLRIALEALPEETEFNLIPYTNVPIPWSDEMQPAKKKEVQRALDFFNACREKGRGNVYDAALLALADPKCDTIVVLTDGVPTGGVHSDMDLIAPLLLERIRFRPLVIDTILVDAPPAAVRRWQDLSKATGGRSIEIDLSAVSK